MSRPPETINLQAHGHSADVAPGFGALLLRFYSKGRSILHCSENWHESFPQSIRTGNPILFPIAGKLSLNGEPDRYERHGKIYTLPLHGFARQLPWKITDLQGDTIECLLSSFPLTQLLFPWEFEIRLRYQLTAEGLVITGQILNQSEEEMPVHFGLHPYLQLEGPQSRYIIRVPESDTVRLVGQPRSTPVKVESREIVPNSSLALTRLYEGVRNPIFQLVQRETGTSTTLSTTTTAFHTWAVWSPQIDAPYICIEPWTASPNALNHGQGLPLLPGGGLFEFNLSIRCN